MTKHLLKSEVGKKEKRSGLEGSIAGFPWTSGRLLTIIMLLKPIYKIESEKNPPKATL